MRDSLVSSEMRLFGTSPPVSTRLFDNRCFLKESGLVQAKKSESLVVMRVILKLQMQL